MFSVKCRVCGSGYSAESKTAAVQLVAKCESKQIPWSSDGKTYNFKHKKGDIISVWTGTGADGLHYAKARVLRSAFEPRLHEPVYRVQVVDEKRRWYPKPLTRSVVSVYPRG